ncbi:uncharacterized protein RHO25_006829 [Cercospora beticola]|uniref:Apple domain-containing protein n=1 Tax=Cercospora beticola TaxID=122368 RepID=A0ABZ0NRM2_CERBT|nr:hypothetical protein RHO25_006829 [Cercospora beticola]
MKVSQISLLAALASSALGDDAVLARQTTPICGITGTKSQVPFTVSVLRAQRSPTGCMDYCKRFRACRSFAVSNTFCWLFNNAGGVNFRYNATSNYKVWDVGYTISANTPGVTTPSTTTTTTTTSISNPVVEVQPTQEPEPGDSPDVTDIGGDGIFPTDDAEFSMTYT